MGFCCLSGYNFISFISDEAAKTMSQFPRQAETPSPPALVYHSAGLEAVAPRLVSSPWCAAAASVSSFSSFSPYRH